MPRTVPTPSSRSCRSSAPTSADAKGVGGFSATVRALRDSGLPVVFLPGVIHLPDGAAHRKLNKIDLGTADKLCVAALALAQHNRDEPAVAVEFGSAFTAMVVLKDRQIVDGSAARAGALGGEVRRRVGRRIRVPALAASEGRLFRGGVADMADRETRPRRVPRIVREGRVGPPQHPRLSGRVLRRHTVPHRPDLTQQALGDLPRVLPVALRGRYARRVGEARGAGRGTHRQRAVRRDVARLWSG